MGRIKKILIELLYNIYRKKWKIYCNWWVYEITLRTNPENACIAPFKPKPKLPKLIKNDIDKSFQRSLIRYKNVWQRSIIDTH